jgi:hypothetical protein
MDSILVFQHPTRQNALATKDTEGHHADSPQNADGKSVARTFARDTCQPRTTAAGIVGRVMQSKESS